MKNTCNQTIDNNTIIVSGTLDGSSAETMVAAMLKNNIDTLDFNKVESIQFAALRILLRHRQSGNKFMIINVSNDVAERFEDTGVSTFINICRKPKPLHIEQYSEFGGGFLSTAFNSEDGDSMIKVYGNRVPKQTVRREKMVARSVMIFGLPTPLVGSIYEEGENTGIDFERIEGKRSFSRIIADEPERLEEISRRFARMCKQLHTTPCDTTIFDNRTNVYRNAILQSKGLNETTRQKALDFISHIPSATTCLHGDMQLSNVITNGIEDLWIDLSDFGYGNPMHDMGMWYFLSKFLKKDREHNIFHLSVEQLSQCWDIFIDEYFDSPTPQAKADIENTVEQYAALHMLYLGITYGYEPGMEEFVNTKLLG